ncbi:MAG: zinc ABC transporter substrate-binding protein [Betaproteobacteria bacterium]
MRTSTKFNKFHIFILVVAGLVLSVGSSPTEAKPYVLTCEPEWRALVQVIGGDRVKVDSATTAQQDPHYIRAKPSLIARARRADLLVCSGAGLESGWLPLLLERASKQIQPGQVGYLIAAEHVPLIEIPELVDRSQGDIHPEGNPHVHLDPANVELIAKLVSQRLSKIDPGSSEQYQKNLEIFINEWKASQAKWLQRAKPLNGKKVVAFHKSFSYLFRFLNIQVIGYIEKKPGIAPSASHLATVVDTVKSGAVLGVVRTPFDPSDSSEWLSQKTGKPSVVLPFTVGGVPEVSDLFSLYEYSIKALLDLVSKS